MVTLSGYAETLSLPSIEGHSLDEIINVIALHSGHKTEAESLRERAAKLLAKAARLDADHA